MIARIVSGGQTGADQGALLAGEALGIPTGGWAPKGWRTDAGPAPWLGSRFGLQEHAATDYRPRTIDNVVGSDATLVFGRISSRGCALTWKTCERYRKPRLYVSWPLSQGDGRAQALMWLRGLGSNAITLNVAGNRESRNPGIQQATSLFLYGLVQELRE